MALANYKGDIKVRSFHCSSVGRTKHIEPARQKEFSLSDGPSDTTPGVGAYFTISACFRSECLFIPLFLSLAFDGIEVTRTMPGDDRTQS